MNKEIDNHSIISDFGYFWFPEEPNERISGTIKREKFNQNFQVHLLKHITDFKLLLDFNKHYDILYGVLSSIGAVTLKSLRVTSTTTNGDYILDAEFLFTNIILENKESDNCFENISTKVFFDGLTNWKFHNHKELLYNDDIISGINLKPLETKSYSVKYKGYQIDLEIVFAFILRDKSISDLDIRDYSYIEFNFERITFDDLMAFFKDFKDLLTVLWGFPAIINNIEFNLIKDDYKFNLYLRQYILRDKFSVKSNENYYPLMLKNIEDDFDTIVDKWFELKYSNKMIVDILMEQYYNPFINPNNDFLALCRAIESFGRSIHENSTNCLKYEKWRKIKHKLMKFLYENYTDKDKLESFEKCTKFQHGISFRDIFISFKSDFSNISNLIELNDESIEKIVNCRNDLTHEKLKDDDVNPLKLYALVNLILLSLLLKELKITDDLIYRAISKNNLIYLLKNK